MPQLPLIQPAPSGSIDRRYDFLEQLVSVSQDDLPDSIRTLQVNVTKLCNQACRHCHVDASPIRTEQMDRRTIDRCLEVFARYDTIENLDITGGAPELNPHFDDFVSEAKSLGKHVLVRHNLTVTLDGHPQTGESKAYLPDFFANHQVEVISSLPYYQAFFTDRQRGKGVFEKSVESLRRLNARGYGKETSGLILNLVYNPVGAFLPADQVELERQFKKELLAKHEIVFNQLFTITNMPIHRFKEQLQRMGGYEEYMERLVQAFNPLAAQNIMCRNLISVGYDGRLYDCDFNQMLDMKVDEIAPQTIFEFEMDALLQRRIQFASHCFGCTAGAGSSCGGELT